MLNLQKASLLMDGNKVNLTMPISKVDVEKRIVSGFATLNNVDKQLDKVLPSASEKAFSNFRGNIRLMHQPIPAGKMISFKADKFFDPETKKEYDGIFVETYISKGAQDIWEMVLDGTLTGFSIGGAIKDYENEFDAEIGKSVRVIKSYDLVELSLVDSPANQFANIFTIQKTIDGDVIDGMFSKSNIQNVFWCESEEIAYLSNDEKYSCSSCRAELPSIGWIDEDIQENIEKSMYSVIDIYKAENAGTVTSEDTINRYPDQNKLKPMTQPKKKALKKTDFKNGDYVQWSSSNGTARGKVTRVVTNGKIKVPNSSLTLEGSVENPAVIVSVYEKSGDSWKPTKVKVGHRMASLKTWSTRVAKSIGEQTGLLQTNVVKMAIEVNEVANPINEGGVEVAENIEATTEEVVEETVDSIEAVEETAEETVEKSDEVQADEAESADTVEEVTEVEETEATEEASTDNGEATDIEKALNDIKNFVTETLTVSTEKNVESVNNVANTLVDVTKALGEKIAEQETKHEELSKTLASVVDAINTIAGRVESVEADTAFKKSGEMVNTPEETTIQKSNSVWGGRFLGSAEYLN